MKKRILALSLMMLGGAVQAQQVPGLGAAKGFSDNVIRIGILTDMSSIYTNGGGIGAVVAARMAVEDFGKNNINGVKIEIISADDGNALAPSQAQAKRMIENEKADFLTGAMASPAALGAIREVHKAKKVITMLGSSSSQFSNIDCTPHSFHWIHDTYNLAYGQVKTAIESGKKKFYVIYQDNAFGQQLNRDTKKLVEKFGGTFVGSKPAPIPNLDYRTLLREAEASGADVIALATAGLDTVNSVRQSAELKSTNVIDQSRLILPLLAFHQDVHLMQPKEMGGAYLTIGYVWNQSPESIEFSKRYFMKTQRMPDVGQAGAYSSVLHYLRAVEKAGTDDGDAIAKVMRETPVNDAIYQNAKIAPNGKLMHEIYTLRVKDPKNQKFPWDLYDIIKVLPGEEAATPEAENTCDYIKGNKPREGSVMAYVEAELSKAKGVTPSPSPAPVVPSANPSPATATPSGSTQTPPVSTDKKDQKK